MSAFVGNFDEGVAFFEKRIRPVMVKNCYQCHSREAAGKGKIKGGLQLDTRAGIRKGGDSGPVLIPGNTGASRIVSAPRQDATLKMPPSGKLPTSIIADVEKWIAMGAPDPRDGAARELVKATDFETVREFWSLRPVAKPSVPSVDDRAGQLASLDAFVRRRLLIVPPCRSRPISGLGPSA
ncbi:MAG: hypothetical protein ACI9OD_001260 [Limisphaerales bacterium]|jgi:hypothetical protein